MTELMNLKNIIFSETFSDYRKIEYNSIYMTFQNCQNCNILLKINI